MVTFNPKNSPWYLVSRLNHCYWLYCIYFCKITSIFYSTFYKHTHVSWVFVTMSVTRRLTCLFVSYYLRPLECHAPRWAVETALGDHCSDGTVSGAVRNTLYVRLLYQYTWKQSYHKGKRPPYLNKESSRQIDPSRKSHNASDIYPTVHHFVTEMCTHVHISVTNWCIVGYGTDGICATGLFVNDKIFADKLHFQLPNNSFRSRKKMISNW